MILVFRHEGATDPLASEQVLLALDDLPLSGKEEQLR